MTNRTEVLGIKIDIVTMAEVVARVTMLFDQEQTQVCSIYTVGPEIIMHARKDKEYASILNSGNIIIPDGIGAVLASKLNKTKLPERVGGCDLAFELFNIMKGNNKTAYFLGGQPGVAKKAKSNIERNFPGLNIVGVNDGFFDEKQEKIIIEELNRLKPDLLLVGTGFPRQEKWIDKNKNVLACRVAIGVGGSIDIFAGNVRRAPKFWVKLNLEWLYRLLSEPRKRFARQLRLPLFVFAVVWNKLTKRG